MFTKERRIFIIQVLLSFILLAYIINKVGISIVDIKSSIQYPMWIVLAIFCRIFIFSIPPAIRWSIFLRYVEIRENLYNLIQISFISSFWGLMMPSSTGFDAFRIYFLEKNHSEQRGRAGATVIAERMLGFFLLSLLGLSGCLLISGVEGVGIIRTTILIISLSLLFIILISTNSQLFSKIIKKDKQPKYNNKVVNYIIKLYEALTLLPMRKIIIQALPFMLLFQLSIILLASFVFMAFGVKLPFVYHLALMPVIQIISIIPASISGFGVRESAFVFFYKMMGVDPVISFCVSISYFLVTLGASAFTGGILSLINQVKKSEIIKI